ncbi:TniQ family protein [Rhizobium sp. LjRoot98]|uniref:TniQ family protein n=1 Tax=Rhizobium sp. LjRoot98 TaxID=3342345 RepID=UPI003ED0638E
MTLTFDIRTTPFSRWSVENAEDEPAHGYFARLVAAEGHSSVTRYSDGIDVDARYMNPESLLNVILRLPLDDIQKHRLRNATPRRSGDGVTLAGQRFNATDFSFSSRRWCPGCLQDSPHHRAWWDIVAIHECPHHGQPLTDTDDQGNQLRWWWSAMTVSPAGALLAARHPRQEGLSTFSSYLVGRLGFGPPTRAPLLDSVDLGSVISVCQLIGRLVSSSWSSTLPPLTSEMVEAGYQALRADAVALVESLRTWIRLSVPNELRTRGYTIVFGWANKQRQVLDNMRLAEVLKKVFRKALALEARSSAGPLTSVGFLNGEIGLTELAKRIGINRRGLPAVADAIGLLPEREWYRAPVKFDPTEADAVEFHVRRMMTRVEVGSKLGLPSQELRALVSAGYLREFADVTTDGSAGLRFLEIDVCNVLRTLEIADMNDNRSASSSFFTYAKNNSIRAGALAVSVLNGQYEITSNGIGKPGFKGIRIAINPPDAAPRFSKQVLSLAESEAELNVDRPTLCRLIEEGHLEPRSKTGNSRLITAASVKKFAAEYRNAREILPFFGDNLRRLMSLMAEHNISPLLERLSNDAQNVNVIYRYADLATVFGLSRDPTRFSDPEFETFWTEVCAVSANSPPYLQLPSALPVSGQIVTNGKRKFSFLVSFNTKSRCIVFEGKRQAAHFTPIELPIADEAGSISRLKELFAALS